MRVNLNESVGADSIAPLLHVAEVIGGIPIEQPEITRNRQTIHHARCTALFIACASRVKFAVLDLTLERIPAPGIPVTHTHCVDMGIINKHLWTVADPPQGVTHLIKTHFVVTKFAHFRLDAFTNRCGC